MNQIFRGEDRLNQNFSVSAVTLVDGSSWESDLPVKGNGTSLRKETLVHIYNLVLGYNREIQQSNTSLFETEQFLPTLNGSKQSFNECLSRKLFYQEGVSDR